MTLSITFYDRIKYNKDDFMNRDRDFFGNGVVQAGDFELGLKSDLRFEIGRGVAWVDGYRIANESGPIALEVEPGGAEPRYDIVQIGHDDHNSRGVLMVKKGVPGSEPIEPGADHGYIKLYSILVGAEAVSLALSDLHDRRERVPLKVSGTQIELDGAAGTGTNTYTGVQSAPSFVATSEMEPLKLPLRASLPAAVASEGTMLVVNGQWYVSDGAAWSQMAAPLSHVGSGDTAHATATTSSAGFLSAADKDKLDGIAAGAQVNQKAFGSVKAGATTIAATGETDTLELVGGQSIAITPDASTKKVTIALSGPKFYNQSAAPAGTAGDQWFDTSVNRWKYHNGTAWVDPLKYQ